MQECDIASLSPPRLACAKSLVAHDITESATFKKLVYLEIVWAVEHVRDELGHESHVGVVAEERLLQQIDSLLRKRAGPCKFRAAGLVLVAEHFQAARTSAMVERAHLRAGDERVALVSEDNVELLADRFVDHVDVHPGAARKQNDFLPFLLECTGAPFPRCGPSELSSVRERRTGTAGSSR